MVIILVLTGLMVSHLAQNQRQAEMKCCDPIEVTIEVAMLI